MNFGNRLRQLRKEKGLTQAELAKLLSIGESTISFYESGKRQPDYETLIRIADLFNVSVDYLLGRTVLDGTKKIDGSYKLNKEKSNKGIETIAAHRTDDPMSELPEEARKSLEEFKEFILRKYGKGRE
ncbi:MAG: helix-turn-helix domain-containing protein [Deltaproteobacteria bacterium]|nr:helix-turn-helix domain-containing protein [Deltaproteobacteria bacterium]